MRARLIRFANQLSESYWFVPTIMALAALLLAAAMIWLDSHHATGWMDSLPWLYAARPDGARSLLSSIGGSMIGVAGTTFSVTIAAVVYASGQYGPRLLSNFMSDRGNQVTLGTFIATFLYSLVVVRTIRSPGETPGEPGFVPQLAVLVGVRNLSTTGSEGRIDIESTQQVVAALRELPGHACAQAGAGAGDEGDLTLKGVLRRWRRRHGGST